MTKFEFIDAQGAAPNNIITVLALLSMTQGQTLTIFEPDNPQSLCQELQNNAFKAVLLPKLLDTNHSDNLMITDQTTLDPIDFPFANDILLTTHFPLPEYHGRFNKTIVVFGSDINNAENIAQAREIYRQVKSQQHEVTFIKYTKSIAKQWLEVSAVGLVK